MIAPDNPLAVALGGRIFLVRQARGTPRKSQSLDAFARDLTAALREFDPSASAIDGPMVSRMETGKRSVSAIEAAAIARLDPLSRGSAWLVDLPLAALPDAKEAAPEAQPQIEEDEAPRAGEEEWEEGEIIPPPVLPGQRPLTDDLPSPHADRRQGDVRRPHGRVGESKPAHGRRKQRGR